MKEQFQTVTIPEYYKQKLTLQKHLIVNKLCISGCMTVCMSNKLYKMKCMNTWLILDVYDSTQFLYSV